MKLHYMGKYNLDPNTLPKREIEGAIQFKELENTKQLAMIGTIIDLMIVVILSVIAIDRLDYFNYFEMSSQTLAGLLLSLVALFPHELLHAICFKEDVYLYTNLKQGMLFVTGTELMSKRRFIMLSLNPNIILGFIPYIIGMIFPQYIGLLVFGIFNIGAGAGDYYNVYNCLMQVPEGAKCFSSGIHTYWYKEETNEE